MIKLALLDGWRSRSRLGMLVASNALFSCLLAILVATFSFFFSQHASYSVLQHAVMYNFTIINNTFIFLTVLLLVIITCSFFMNAILFSFHVDKRIHDIALMKAHGMPESTAVSTFFLQHLIAFLAGLASGLVPVIISSSVLFPGQVSWADQEVSLLLLFITGHVATGFWTDRRRINLIYARSIMEATRSDWTSNLEITRAVQRSKQFFRKLGPTMVYSYKSVVTRRDDSRKALLLLACAMLVCGTLFTSSAATTNTYHGLVAGSLGGGPASSTVLVAHRSTIEFVQKVYGTFNNNDFFEDMITYDASANVIEVDTLDLSPFNNSIVIEDWRYMFMTSVHEITGFQLNPHDSGFTEVGKARSLNAVVFAVHFDSMFNQWDAVINPGDVVVGDSVAGLMFENIAIQKLGIAGLEYKMAGQVFDTAFNGFSVYVSANQVPGIINTTSIVYNCLFLTVDVENITEFIIELGLHVGNALGDDFIVYSLNDTFSNVMASVNVIATIQNVLATIVLVFMFLFLLEFTNILVSWNKQDYLVMSSLGIPTGKVRRMIMGQFLFVSGPATIIALALALITTSLLSITGLVIPSISFPVGVFSGMFGALLFLHFLYLRFLVRAQGIR